MTAFTASPVCAQVSGQGGTASPPALPSGRGDLIRVKDNPDRRSIEYVIGPIRLPPETGILRVPAQMTSMPLDGWLHGYSVTMKDADGLLLPAELLHHINFIDPDQRELFSPVSRRDFAAGTGTGRGDIPGLIGFPVQAGDRFLVTASFQNPATDEVRDAYLHVEFSYSLEGQSLIEPRNVYPFHLDVMGFAGPRAFVVPPGRSRRAWQGSPAVPGRILAFGGHVHDFATRLRLVDVTDGTVLWDVTPHRDRSGRVGEIPIDEIWLGLGRKIRPDHAYRIEVEYENPLEVPAPAGGMGEIGGIILVEKGIAWPSLQPDDPTYARDLEDTLAASARGTAPPELAP